MIPQNYLIHYYFIQWSTKITQKDKNDKMKDFLLFFHQDQLSLLINRTSRYLMLKSK